MYDITKLVSQSVFDFLLNNLPSPKQLNIGRKRIDKPALLNGILQVLVNGVAWNKIAECGCSYSSCFRYFKKIQRRGLLNLVFDSLLKDVTDIGECAIDSTTVTSFRFKSFRSIRQFFHTAHHSHGNLFSKGDPSRYSGCGQLQGAATFFPSGKTSVSGKPSASYLYKNLPNMDSHLPAQLPAPTRVFGPNLCLKLKSRNRANRNSNRCGHHMYR